MDSAMPRVSVVRIGGVPVPVCESIAEGVSRHIDVCCSVADMALDPGFSFDERRGQYSSTRLLEHLSGCAQDGCVLGVTDVDLFMPVLTFVFGEAVLRGNAAVISTYRLRPSFYGMPEDLPTMLIRAQREAIHEMGHALGLVHCPAYECTMHATRSVEEIDLATGGLCEACEVLVSGVVRAAQLRAAARGSLQMRRQSRSLRSFVCGLLPFVKSCFQDSQIDPVRPQKGG